MVCSKHRTLSEKGQIHNLRDAGIRHTLGEVMATITGDYWVCYLELSEEERKVARQISLKVSDDSIGPLRRIWALEAKDLILYWSEKIKEDGDQSGLIHFPSPAVLQRAKLINKRIGVSVDLLSQEQDNIRYL